jgi:hypothetical protein
MKEKVTEVEPIIIMKTLMLLMRIVNMIRIKKKKVIKRGQATHL